MTTISVPDMMCENCVKRITNALTEADLPVLFEQYEILAREMLRRKEEGRGFTFQSYNADDFLAAIDRALALYYNEPEKWLRLAENDMAVDSSWDVPAQKYMALFQNVCGQ